MAERQRMTAEEVVAKLMSDEREHADFVGSRFAGWLSRG
jgi:hypothetical protein